MTLIGIQVRTNSSRLPGKAKAMIGGKPMLQHVIERAKQIPVDSPKMVMVLTTGQEDDDWVVDLCRVLHISHYRGQPVDVLARYAHAACNLEMEGREGRDAVMRLTGDCPLLDPFVSSQVLQLYLRSGADYASNTREWPDGLDTEVFSAELLFEAGKNATTAEDREHVTPWIRRHGTCEEVPLDPSRREIKWSVDTQEDLELVREVYRMVGGSTRWEDALAAMTRRGCPHCQAKVPHVEQRGRVIWELHAPGVPGGKGRAECLNPRIAQRGALA